MNINHILEFMQILHTFYFIFFEKQHFSGWEITVAFLLFWFSLTSFDESLTLSLSELTNRH